MNSPAQIPRTSDPAVLRAYVELIKARQGASQRYQAEYLGVGWTTFCDWLSGKAKWPKTAQMALEAWSVEPLPEDEDGIVALCQVSMSLEEERALIAAWKCVQGNATDYTLVCTVKDWSVEMLKSFARDGYRDKDFREAVRAQLFDQVEVDGRLRDLPMPERGAEALFRKAYEWCAPAVLERLADLLDE